MMIGTDVMMGFCTAKFSLPFAAFLFVLTVNLQLVNVTNYSPVRKILALQINTAMWTIFTSSYRLFQALLAKDLPTAACSVGLPGNQSANEADVVIRWKVADKLVVISSFKSDYESSKDISWSLTNAPKLQKPALVLTNEGRRKGSG